MLSIIICSIDNERAQAVTANIQATIGVEHEVIIINNAKELGGMGAGYNAGAARAKYDILCFVHDDVEYLTKDWGHNVIAHFKCTASLGIIGLAGSRYKSKTLSGWYTSMPHADCCNIYQRTPKSQDKKVLLRPAGKGGIMIPVKTLDGVWLCTPKKVWSAFPFNTTELKSFHWYDLDISLRISQAYTVAVVYDIDLVHFSKGNFGDEWVKGAMYFHEHVNKVALPVSLDPFDPAVTEPTVCRAWLRRLRIENISWTSRQQWATIAGVNAFPHMKRALFGFYFPYIRKVKMRLKALLS